MGAGATLLGLVGVVALVGEGSFVDMGLPLGNVTAVMLHMVLLALVFGGLALAVGAWTGHSVLSRAVPAALAVVAYVVNGLAPMVSWLQPAQRWSPFYQYIGHDPLRTGVSWPSVGIAVATLAVLALLAVLGFRRRDVLS
jgi:ABC-2 type transport system permease protein